MERQKVPVIAAYFLSTDRPIYTHELRFDAPEFSLKIQFRYFNFLKALECIAGTEDLPSVIFMELLSHIPRVLHRHGKEERIASIAWTGRGGYKSDFTSLHPGKNCLSGSFKAVDCLYLLGVNSSNGEILDVYRTVLSHIKAPDFLQLPHEGLFFLKY